MRRMLLSAASGGIRLLPLALTERRGRAEARHRHAGRTGAAGRFHALPYANPDAPKGGSITYAWSGTFDNINPFIVQGSGGARQHRPDLRQHRLRAADAAFDRRAVHALSAAGQDGRDRRRAQLRRVHSRRARKILRRRAGDAGRCDVHLRCFATRAGRATAHRRARSPSWKRPASTACASPSSSQTANCR